MRALRCVMAGFVVFGLAAVVAADHHEGLMAEVEAIGATMEKALVEGDVETMLGFYTEDAISLPNFGPRMDGVATFRKHHEEMTASGMKIKSFESTPTEAWSAGDQVIEIGTFEITLDMPGMPDPIEDHGKYMTVYARQTDGSLKIKAETWNTDVDPMSMMGNHHGEGHGEMHEGHGEMHEHGDMHEGHDEMEDEDDEGGS